MSNKPASSLAPFTAHKRLVSAVSGIHRRATPGLVPLASPEALPAPDSRSTALPPHLVRPSAVPSSAGVDAVLLTMDSQRRLKLSPFFSAAAPLVLALAGDLPVLTVRLAASPAHGPLGVAVQLDARGRLTLARSTCHSLGVAAGDGVVALWRAGHLALAGAGLLAHLLDSFAASAADFPEVSHD